MNIPKYRAWDTKRKQMLYNIPWLLLDKKTGTYAVGTLAIPDAFGSDEQAYKIHGYLDGGIYPYPAAILMQCTPLKDKHDTEIYQSDILELNCLGWGGPYKDRAVVVWEGFGWYFRFADGRLQPVEQKWQSECEVIGNSYEHPDQLQQQSPH